MITDLYDVTGYVQSPAKTQDSYGQEISTWGSTSERTIACALQGRSGNYPVITGVQFVQKTFRMYCSSTVSFTLQDRLRVSTSYYYPTFVNDKIKRSDHLQIDLELGNESRS